MRQAQGGQYYQRQRTDSAGVHRPLGLATTKPCNVAIVTRLVFDTIEGIAASDLVCILVCIRKTRHSFLEYGSLDDRVSSPFSVDSHGHSYSIGIQDGVCCVINIHIGSGGILPRILSIKRRIPDTGQTSNNTPNELDSLATLRDLSSQICTDDGFENIDLRSHSAVVRSIRTLGTRVIWIVFACARGETLTREERQLPFVILVVPSECGSRKVSKSLIRECPPVASIIAVGPGSVSRGAVSGTAKVP